MYWGLLVNLMNPMNRVAAFFGDISKAIVGAGRVFELLDLPVETRDAGGAHPLPAVRGRIEFDDVSFSYGGDERRRSRTSTRRSKRAKSSPLVGPSGAGKTTIVNLVPRFYEPQAGCVESTASISRRYASPICAKPSRSFRKTPNSSAARFWKTSATAVSKHRRRGAGGRARRQRRRVRARLSRRLRHRSRRTRRPTLRRRTSTHRDCPGDPARSAHSDPGRSNQRARQPLRGDDRASPRPPVAGPDDADYRAPPLDRSAAPTKSSTSKPAASSKSARMTSYSHAVERTRAFTPRNLPSSKGVILSGGASRHPERRREAP